MPESLAHKNLKNEAVAQLKNLGFLDDEIKEEQWVYFKWEGEEHRYRVDVLGDNGEKKVIFQVGNHGRKEILLLKKYFDTHYISYPLYNPLPKIKQTTIEDLHEKKETLYRIYDKIYQHFKDDEIFDFIELNDQNKKIFKLGKDDSWMLLPNSMILNKDELMSNINICIEYVGNDLFRITINAEQNESIKLFLDITQSDKDRYINEVNKLPSGYFIQDGYKYRPKGLHPLTRLPRNWDDVQPYNARDFSSSDLKDIEMRLTWLLNSKEQNYPVFSILATYVKKEDILGVFHQIKPIYKILKTMKTVQRSVMEKMKSFPDWCWYVDEKKYSDFFEYFCEKYPDVKISFKDFKFLMNKLKKDDEFRKYLDS